MMRPTSITQGTHTNDSDLWTCAAVWYTVQFAQDFLIRATCSTPNAGTKLVTFTLTIVPRQGETGSGTQVGHSSVLDEERYRQGRIKDMTRQCVFKLPAGSCRLGIERYTMAPSPLPVRIYFDFVYILAGQCPIPAPVPAGHWGAGRRWQPHAAAGKSINAVLIDLSLEATTSSGSCVPFLDAFRCHVQVSTRLVAAC